MERKWWTLVVVCLSIFMLLLDITIVNVALPDIARDLQGELQRSAVGGRRLRAHPGRPAAHRRVARRSPRAPAGVRRRARAVHARLAGVRPRARLARPDPRPRSAGDRRRGALLGLPRAARPGVRGPRAGDGVRLLGRDDRRRGGGRAAGRGRAHLRPGLAVHLLPQPPDRRGRAVDHAHPRARDAGPAGRADRLAGDRDVLRRPVRARLRAHPRQRRGVGEHGDRGADRRRRGAARGLRRGRAAPGAADVRPRAVPQAGLLRRLDRRVHALGLDVRDVPLPHDLHPDDPRVRAVRGRAAVPADHAPLVLRGRGLGADDRARAGAGAARRRAAPRRRSGCC